MSYTLTVEPEQVDAIIISELKSNIDSLERNLESTQDADEDYLGVFDNDPKKDADMIVQHIEALKMIIEYYGGETTIF